MIGLACLASLGIKLGRVPQPFVDSHAWVSAHFSIMARNYVDHGFWKLQFAPVQNTGPLEPRPDYYLHWPFLFQIALGLWFKAWGISEASGRLLAAVISTGTVAAVAAAHWRARQPIVAAVAALTTAFLPTQLYYGASVLHLVLAVALWSAAVQALVSVVRSGHGAIAYVAWASLAMLTSWETFLGAVAPLILWVVYRTPALKRTAVHSLLAAAAIVIGLFAYMAAIDPGSVRDTIGMALWRAGLTSARPLHWFPDDPASVLGNLTFAVRAYAVPEMTWPTLGVGALGALVLGLRAARRQLPVEITTPVVGFALPPVLWYLLMPRHVRYHDYELLLAVPIVATFVAWGVLGGGKWLAAPARRLRIPAALPGLLLLAWAASGWYPAYATMQSSVNPRFKALGETLAGATSPSDRVITDIPNQTIDFYANRRIYRVPCDLESVTRIHTGIDGRDGHFHVIFATWADRAGLLRVCPGLVDVLGRRYQSREVGLVRIFDLEQPLPGGAGR